MPMSRERMREYMRARRAADPERTRSEAAEAYERMKRREAADPSLRERREAKRRQWVEANRERVAEHARLRYNAIRVNPVADEELRARNRNGMLKYRGSPAYRQKARARWLVGAWIRRGKLVRGPCVDCGSLLSEAHHADYSKPLEIEWVCHRCHVRRHRRDAESDA